MANQSLHSPTNPHFFQPLLPGFNTHLKIPIAFFLRHVQGRNDYIKIAKLRSDASDKTWLVKRDGRRLTDGWEDFAVAHDLRVGDMVVFRHEGEMVFHVTSLGPSCCEIQYSLTHNINDDSHDQTNNFVTAKSLREKRKRVKKNKRKEVDSSSDRSRFVANVTVSNLRDDQLYLPRRFARSNGLDKMSGKKIVLCNEEGGSWDLTLRYNKVGMHTLAKPGWRRLCDANGMKRGQYTFKLVQKSEPPVIRLCSAEHRPESESKSSSHHACFAGSVRPSSLINDRLYLRKDFVSDKGDKTPLESPENSDDVESLSSDTSSGDESSESHESEKENLGDENISQKYLEMEKKMRCSASSSYSQDQFVMLTLTPYAFKQSKLTLPVGFTRINGINNPGKITLLGHGGVKQVVELLQDKGNRVMRLGSGWRGFCEAQGIKIGESFLLELIWEEETSPVLKFCTKRNSA